MLVRNTQLLSVLGGLGRFVLMVMIHLRWDSQVLVAVAALPAVAALQQLPVQAVDLVVVVDQGAALQLAEQEIHLLFRPLKVITVDRL